MSLINGPAGFNEVDFTGTSTFGNQSVSSADGSASVQSTPTPVPAITSTATAGATATASEALGNLNYFAQVFAPGGIVVPTSVNVTANASLFSVTGATSTDVLNVNGSKIVNATSTGGNSNVAFTTSATISSVFTNTEFLVEMSVFALAGPSETATTFLDPLFIPRSKPRGLGLLNYRQSGHRQQPGHRHSTSRLTPTLRYRPRCVGATCTAQEAESNREGLDNFVGAREGRRVGGLFYFIALFPACPLLALSGHGGQSHAKSGNYIQIRHVGSSSSRHTPGSELIQKASRGFDPWACWAQTAWVRHADIRRIRKLFFYVAARVAKRRRGLKSSCNSGSGPIARKIWKLNSKNPHDEKASKFTEITDRSNEFGTRGRGL